MDISFLVFRGNYYACNSVLAKEVLCYVIVSLLVSDSIVLSFLNIIVSFLFVSRLGKLNNSFEKRLGRFYAIIY